MSIPVHLSLTDSNGSPIRGSSLVAGREGSIEILRFSHGMHIPFDGNSGMLTGTRVHSPIVVEKDIDRSSPYLYRALCQHQTLQKGIFRWYQINDAGHESEFFNITVENIKICTINPLLPHIKSHTEDRPAVPCETMFIAYEKITWCYLEGNIQYSDQWNSRSYA